jgi:hypothetical protein
MFQIQFRQDLAFAMLMEEVLNRFRLIGFDQKG